MKKIKINFTDWWSGFDKTNNYFYNLLKDEFDIEISNGYSYSSNIDWNKFMSDIYEINIKVPNDYDLNYLVSTLIHELRHIIDFSDGAKSSGLSSFLMDYQNIYKHVLKK